MYKEHRKDEVSQRMDSIIAGKKAKKRKLLDEANSVGQAAENTSGNGDGTKQTVSKSALADEKDEDDDDIDSLTVEDIVTTETSEEHSLVQIFTR